MKRIEPAGYLHGYPCSVVAVACAIGSIPDGVPVYLEQLRADGYATLQTANRFIRGRLPVRKRTDYKRGQRPKLKELNLDGKAVVCVYGHMVYVENDSYWSFFENEEDEVVTVWMLKD